MDQAVRNKLRSVVTQCRRLLEQSVGETLQGQFGIYASGKKGDVKVEDEARMSHLSDEDRACRKDLVDHFEHIQALGYRPQDALAQLIREIAFTHLNRLCAYKMMEARGLIREGVSRGVKSQGFLFYLADHPEDEKRFNSGEQDVAYRHFLDWLGGTLSEEIGVLFNPNDPANRLYPPQRTLDGVLDLLSGGDIKPEETALQEVWAGIWLLDETIGWVYQYFTPKELRDQARKESSAPRNSYELAFRNQFFTPRYVVEFLTDNTLGRIWYEMRQGATRLTEQCRYLVRRPNETFLNEGQEPPKEAAESQDDLSQEKLLRQPLYVPHRPKKDPRELKILDPACGSGHFLLYCFDLLETIYDEAYDDPELSPALQHDYPAREEYKKAVPGMVLARNLHGIDIDLRATQIAALALWLRCQRAFQEIGIKKDRPRITRSNIVCAEPMPGESEMLREFVADLHPRVLGQLVEVVFDKMKLAGEAGSLLKIEEELSEAIAEARRQWAQGPKDEQLMLFEPRESRPEQQLLFDVSGITEEEFWREAEANVLTSLKEYVRRAVNGKEYQRELFVEDAERGFAFLDVVQKCFDVILMNPPFGDCTKPAKLVIEGQYPRTKNDLYAAFVERGLTRLLDSGLLGAITSRTGFFLSSFQKWREEILLSEAPPTAVADLGYGVLDTAMVETAAYCLTKGKHAGPATFFRLLHADEKQSVLRSAVSACSRGEAAVDVYLVAPASFEQVPGAPFAYWATKRIRRLFQELPPFENKTRTVRIGMKTGNDFRFLRAWWETDASSRWVPYAKGGAAKRYYSDLPLVVNWENDGKEVKEFVSTRMQAMFGNNSWEFWISNSDFYFMPGLTWPLRAASFSPAVLPAGSIFSVRGYAILASRDELLVLAGLCNSASFDFLFKLMLGRFGFPEFIVGTLRQVPTPVPSAEDAQKLAHAATICVSLSRLLETPDDTARVFTLPALLQSSGESLGERFTCCERRRCESETMIGKYQNVIDEIGFAQYGIEEDRTLVEETRQIGGLADEDTPPAEREPDGTLIIDVIVYSVGCVVGRWDIRLAIGQKPLPELPDPFDPLPACPPGMLQGPDGLPAKPEDVPSDYPVGIDWDGILVDDPDHTDDIVRRVREVLELIWKGQADAIEKEACEILGVKGLRDYFRKPSKGGFWDDHVKRYSKSRRKAPIYWLLQSSRRNYALWLYYHRLDKDMLFKALVNYVEPKIRLEENRLESLRSQKAAGGGSKKLDKDMERQEDLLSELRDFEDKLRRAANLHLEPDLNDGVVLNIAPLRELVPWKEAQKYWEELTQGKYEWSTISGQLRERSLVNA